MQSEVETGVRTLLYCTVQWYWQLSARRSEPNSCNGSITAISFITAISDVLEDQKMDFRTQNTTIMTMIRTFSVWITFLCFLGVQAWNPSSRAVQQLRKQLATVAIVTACSLPCQALDPSIYSGDYADPFHPLCERHIRVEEGSNVFHYSGTAVGSKDDSVKRGCSPFEIKQYGLRKGAFDGVILENGNLSAGDGIHEGIWEPSNN